MTKRIEQSRRHGHHDPRWTSPVAVASEMPLPMDVPEEPIHVPPTLTLVGGTDVAPTAVDPIAVVGS